MTDIKKSSATATNHQALQGTGEGANPLIPFSLYHNIPNELKGYNNWLVHRNKVPYNARTGEQGNSGVHLSSWLEAVQAYNGGGYSGLGFQLEGTPYTVIDLDHHIKEGILDELAFEVYQLCYSYTEVSPSGEGLHIWVKGDAPHAVKNSKEGVEIYSTGRYITFTGNKLEHAPLEIAHRQTEINTLCELYKTGASGEAVQLLAFDEVDEMEADRIISKATKYDQTGKFTMLFHYGDTSAYNGDNSSADMALLCILAYWTKDPNIIHACFNKSKLAERDKWQVGNTGHNPMYYRLLSIGKAIAFQRQKEAERVEKFFNNIYDGWG